MSRLAEGSSVIWLRIKMSFNYCSSGGGQNFIIPVVYDVPG